MSSFYDNLLHYSSYVQPPVLVRALLHSALHGASCPQEVAFFMLPERSEAQSKNPSDLADSNVPGSLDSARHDNGLLFLFLLWSFFFHSRSRRSSSFALFLFLGDHFRFRGSSLSFRCNGLFLSDRRQNGEGRQIELHFWRYA